MGLTITFVQALHGDSILVKCPSERGDIRILIDGGPKYAFRVGRVTDHRQGKLKKLLDGLINNGFCLDLIILTHVDDDHVGGLVAGFENSSYLSKMTKAVLFNSGSLISSHFSQEGLLDPLTGNFCSSNFTSIGQGITFEKYISDLNIWHRILAMRDVIYSELPSIKITFLSPSDDELQELKNRWDEKEPKRRGDTSASRNDYKHSYEELLSEDKFEEDKSVTNGSSISFILESNGVNLVFLADAFPSTIVDSLRQLGYTEDAPLVASLVKISHHGSKGNTNYELLRLIDSQKYVISTNGSVHGHPDKVTLARIHKIRPDATIYFNYPEIIHKIFSAQELAALGEKVKGIDGDLTID
jgi:beta-lactamase superfamily II metal-dependent hydrolase